MIDLNEGERRRTVRLALALSAGLHVLALMTLDLAPGTWRHGVAPALRVVLKTAPGDSTLSGTHVPARPAREGVPQTEQPKAHAGGIDASRTQAGSSVPTAIRYYRNSEVDVPATPVVRGLLVFPEHLYVAKLKGTLKARIFIDEHGTVESVQILEAKPRAGLFEEAAIEALRQTRYRPAEIAGQAVKSQKLIEVTFDPYEDVHGAPSETPLVL